MKEIFKKLMEAELVWRRTEGVFYGTSDKSLNAQLRFNDFPDYPWPITMIIGDEEQDLEGSLPKTWTLVHRAEH